MEEGKNTVGYKATDKGMLCRGYQYTLGEWHVHDGGEISMCKSGFHFCENPLDVLDSYNLCESEFYSVEAIPGKKDDKKTVTSSIKLTASLGLPGFIKASVEYIKNMPSASGDSSQLAASGDSSQLAASGDSSKLAASGDSSKLAASGHSSKLAASGHSSVVAGIGENNIAKGVLGTWLVLAEWKYDRELGKDIPVCVKVERVDGARIKADVYYRLSGGEFVVVD